MKIAIITSGILPVPAVQGGAVENLIDFYLKYNELHKEHDITVYSVYHPLVSSLIKEQRTIHYHYIPTHSLWYRIKKHVYKHFHKKIYYNYHFEFFLYEIINDLKKKDYDTIIFENRPGFILPVSRISKAQMVLHLHNDFLNHTTPYAETILDKCQSVLTVSDFIKERVLTIKKSRKVQTVYNGIDLSIFQKQKALSNITRKKLNLSETDFVLIYSGRIMPEKGVKELIQAMLLLKSYPQIKLIIVGGSFLGSSLQKDKYIQSLKNIAIPIKQQIRFTGFVPYETISSYLSLADTAIVPSTWEEPFGLTALEAMAMALPLIITKSGGLPEIAQNCSISIPNDDNLPEHIANTVIQLYSNPKMRERMGQDALLQSQKFSKDIYSANFFHQLTNQRPLSHSENANSQQ